MGEPGSLYPLCAPMFWKDRVTKHHYPQRHKRSFFFGLFFGLKASSYKILLSTQKGFLKKWNHRKLSVLLIRVFWRRVTPPPWFFFVYVGQIRLGQVDRKAACYLDWAIMHDGHAWLVATYHDTNKVILFEITNCYWLESIRVLIQTLNVSILLTWAFYVLMHHSGILIENSYTYSSRY